MKYIMTFESLFVSKEEVDNLLDKINYSGIMSLSDIDKNRLSIFSEDDKKIISIIDDMGDITSQFKKLNYEMNRRISDGDNTKDLMNDWLELNKEMVRLESEITSYGIELGDERLTNLMKRTRPDVYTDVLESNNLPEKEVVFTNKRNRQSFSVFKNPDGRITRIENCNIRFPFSIGQILNRTTEVWACNNNYLIDGKDTCPEKKIFGVRTKDVPSGHEWRHIFPHKF